MRNLSLAVLFLTAATGVFLGCDGGATRKPTTTGSGGKGGSTGTAGTGAAGTGVSGTTGSAGDGAAGTTGVAGTTGGAGTGVAGTTGAAGDSGAAGTAPPPPPPTCDNMTKKALPYSIIADFNKIVVLHGDATSQAFKVLTGADCDMTVFPPLNPPADGGVDGGSDGGVDGGDAATLQLDDPDAGDAGVDKPADAPVSSTDAKDGGTDTKDGSAADVVADAGTPPGACIAMTYNPAACIATGSTNCWDGVIFAPVAPLAGNDTQGICIEEGATKIEFWARSSNPTAMIKWGGAWEGPGDGVTEFFFPVTTTWAKYTIASPANKPYNTSSTKAGVWNGFSIVGTQDQHPNGTYIFVRDIKWIK